MNKSHKKEMPASHKKMTPAEHKKAMAPSNCKKTSSHEKPSSHNKSKY